MTLATSSLFARTLALATVVFVGATPVAAQDAPLERGRYLVTTILACGNCHTPKDAEGRAISGRELAGGGVGFDIPPYAGVASNITPDRETGIGAWSDAEIKRAITHGDLGTAGAIDLGIARSLHALQGVADLEVAEHVDVA